MEELQYLPIDDLKKEMIDNFDNFKYHYCIF